MSFKKCRVLWEGLLRNLNEANYLSWNSEINPIVKLRSNHQQLRKGNLQQQNLLIKSMSRHFKHQLGLKILWKTLRSKIWRKTLIQFPEKDFQQQNSLLRQERDLTLKLQEFWNKICSQSQWSNQRKNRTEEWRLKRLRMLSIWYRQKKMQYRFLINRRMKILFIWLPRDHWVKHYRHLIRLR